MPGTEPTKQCLAQAGKIMHGTEDSVEAQCGIGISKSGRALGGVQHFRLSSKVDSLESKSPKSRLVARVVISVAVIVALLPIK